MKLKRGDKGENGMIYWGKNSKSPNGEYWMSPQQFERSKLLKKKRYEKKRELLNNKNNNIYRGFEREDGMIFWGYHPDCKNGEKWLTKIEYDRKILDIHKKLLKAKDHGTKRRGEIRDDGMIFWSYSHSHAGSEWWVTKSEFDRMRRNQIKASRKYYQKNPEKCIEYTKKWRERNPEAASKYFESNKKKIYDRRNKRMYSDPLFACRMRIHNNIKQAISKFLYSKQSKTADILGCSFEQFKAHLESQFKLGMSWDNRHLWHIDHIMPVSMAKTYDEVVRLNHYKNLRPMWAEENLRKSDKTPDVLVLF
jgi:hypothetical protein